MVKSRIYFVTDVHGSERCFRKFINAGNFYKANILILGGDITGKSMIPIIKESGTAWSCSAFGQNLRLKSQEEVESAVKMIRDSGAYPYLTDRGEFEELESKSEQLEQLFNKLMIEGVRRWMTLAEERLKGSGIKCYISPGNDDIFDIDEALNSSSYVINPEQKVVNLDGEHEMITLGYTNHTPWNSPREVDEEVLMQKIEKMCSDIKSMNKAIFNIHVPPINTPIDQAPKLDGSLKPVFAGGQMQLTSAGSLATRKAIEKYQPLIGLHGHIHESRGTVKIGKTLCFNPGSEYSSGILRGLICEVDSDKVKLHILTSG